MFKKLLGIVLALTLALGACSAVFAEKANTDNWREAADAKIHILYDPLAEIVRYYYFNKDIESLAEAIVEIDVEIDPEAYEYKKATGNIMTVDDVIKKIYDFVYNFYIISQNFETPFTGIWYNLDSNPDYSQDNFNDDMEKQVKLLQKALEPNTVNNIKEKIIVLKWFKETRPDYTDKIDKVICFLERILNVANVIYNI